MVHSGGSHSPLATPAARTCNTLKEAFVGLELAESGPALDFEPKQINTNVRVWILRWHHFLVRHASPG